MNTNTKEKNLELLKRAALNPGKVIYSSTINVDGTVKDLTADLTAIEVAGKGKPTFASFSVISSETNLIVARYTQDGIDPVATTIGEPMYNKDKVYIQEYYNLQRFKVTEEDGAYTTSIVITYYK